MSQPVGQPAYLRVAEDLRQQIRDGRVPVGSPIPSSSQLRTIYRVSSTVVRAAVNQLRGEGLVVGQPGKAVYVRATPGSVEQETRSLASVVTGLERLGERVEQLAKERPAQADAGLDQVRQEVRALSRSVALLQSNLMNLYAQMGHHYPHDAPAATDAREASGT